MTARRSVGRAAAVTAVLFVSLVSLAGAAQAIETADFGMEPASGSEAGGALRIEAPAGGGESERELRVWNKTKQPLVVQLQVVSATRGGDGAAVLGGESPALGWVTLSPTTVTIPAKSQRAVGVHISLPPGTGPGAHTFAVVAEPATPAGKPPPAVVARVAVAGYLDVGRADTSHHTSTSSDDVGLLPVLAGVLALVAVVSFAVRQRLVTP